MSNFISTPRKLVSIHRRTNFPLEEINIVQEINNNYNQARIHIVALFDLCRREAKAASSCGEPQFVFAFYMPVINFVLTVQRKCVRFLC